MEKDNSTASDLPEKSSRVWGEKAMWSPTESANNIYTDNILSLGEEVELALSCLRGFIEDTHGHFQADFKDDSLKQRHLLTTVRDNWLPQLELALKRFEAKLSLEIIMNRRDIINESSALPKLKEFQNSLQILRKAVEAAEDLVTIRKIVIAGIPELLDNVLQQASQISFTLALPKVPAPPTFGEVRQLVSENFREDNEFKDPRVAQRFQLQDYLCNQIPPGTNLANHPMVFDDEYFTKWFESGEEKKTVLLLERLKFLILPKIRAAITDFMEALRDEIFPVKVRTTDGIAEVLLHRLSPDTVDRLQKIRETYQSLEQTTELLEFFHESPVASMIRIDIHACIFELLRLMKGVEEKIFPIDYFRGDSEELDDGATPWPHYDFNPRYL